MESASCLESCAPPPKPSISDLPLAVVAFAELALLPPGWMFYRFHRRTWGSWRGPQQGRWLRSAGVGLAFGLAAYVVLGLGGALLQKWAHFKLPRQSLLEALAVAQGWQLGLLILTIVLVAPFAEEILFRGVMFGRGWIECRPVAGALISACLFAVIHVQPVGLLPVFFLLGLALAWLFWKTKDLVAPIGAHVAFNLVGVAGLLLTRS